MAARLKSILVAAFLSIVATIVVLAPGDPALAASCPATGSTVINDFLADGITGTNVNFRTGESTGCASMGFLQRTDDITMKCWEFGQTVNVNGRIGNRWVWLFSQRFQRNGWVFEFYVPHLPAGPAGNCPFI